MVLKNKMILFVKVSAALILLLIAFSTFSGAVNNKISPQVESLMLTHDKVPVMIVLKDKPVIPIESKELTINSMKNHASSSQQQLVDLLKDEKVKGKADKIKQFWIVNAIAVNASPGVIKAISIRDDVESIELDSEVHILEDLSTQVTQEQIDTATNAIKQINATNAWKIGIDGTGINVSVLDTGIYAAHPDIAGRIIKGYDFVNNDNDPADDDGHGTHVAGTVGGNGAGGTTTGVAPNVSLLIAKVCNSGGWCLNSDIVDAIQWSVANGADIISMSLGDTVRSNVIHLAINNAISMEVVVIAAAGNEGPYSGTINYPGGEKNVIAVGAVSGSDVIAYFSSRGPITVDGEVLTKPDVSAPGVNINSLSYTSSGYSGYTWSGTSMATPHVSGAAALLLQAARQLGTTPSPAQIKSILENTSVDKGLAGKDNNYGAGRIDAFAAIESLVPPPIGFINGTVMDSVDKTGIAGVIISTNTSISTMTDATGFYSLALTSGTYNLTATILPTYYTDRAIRVSPVINAEVIQNIELLKKPTGNISGTITI